MLDRRTLRKPLMILAALLCAAGSQAQTVPGAAEPLRVYLDVPYRSGADPMWRLDLALPAGKSAAPRPAIVIIHGGGWRAGSKNDAVYRHLLTDYAHQGYVTVSIDYRMVAEETLPVCVKDVRCAIKWLRAHARELNVDPDRIGAYGHSAGAHLSLMAAMLPDTTSLDDPTCDWNATSARLTAAAAGATPTEPGERLAQRWGTPQWWPVSYIRRDVPPLLLLQGTADPIVNVALVDTFIERLKQAGADVQYVRVDGGTHDVAYNANLNITKPAMDAFFRRALKER